MPQPCRPAGFAQKTKPRRFVTEISLADDFQCHGAVQIDVKRLVSNAHCTATQLDRFSVFARDQLIVLKSVRRVLRCRLERILRRRLGGLSPASETLAHHADRTEFHRSRKLVAATRAGAFCLRAHSPNRPSATTSGRKQRHAPPSGAKPTGTAPCILLSRSTKRMRYITA